jgi:hypothetical protein
LPDRKPLASWSFLVLQNVQDFFPMTSVGWIRRTFGNGVIEKMDAAGGPLKGSDANSPSMSCHCDAAN